MKRYGLRDGQFARIENPLPGRPGHAGRNSEGGNRLFVEAVIWKFRSGAPWAAICRSASAAGGTSTRDFRGGRRAAFGRVFSGLWRTTRITNTR